MKNNGTEILDQILNRWATSFRVAQSNRVLNNHTIEKLGLFNLSEMEVLHLIELHSSLKKNSEAESLA